MSEGNVAQAFIESPGAFHVGFLDDMLKSIASYQLFLLLSP